MKPTDRAYQALERSVYVALDPHGSAKRARWLRYIDADADGCWIWTGTVNRTKKDGPGFPQFSMMGLGRKDCSAITAMMLLWAPEQAQHSRRWLRRCGKRLCVRPSCLTTDRRFINDRERSFDLEELRRMRAAGVMFKDCAEHFGVSISTLSGAASLHGMSKRRRSPMTLDTKRLLYDLWRAGVSQNQAADKIEWSRGTVRGHYQRFRRGYNPWNTQPESPSGHKNTQT